MTKQEKILNLTCSECFTTYELLEIHQKEHNWHKSCAKNCSEQWKQLLHNHYQEQIILHLAQEEAKKDQNDYEDKN